ncbi:uncharacterized protein L201_003724 [Kwoniella dendrophila CBS 6074]|uniref:Structural maintenance of chromosomes protein 5 n=1 Tax=Kwoniella dendrophila CBS 6074 TaxID=1295534 RepID=A0AAX4JTQ0_9TREE
MSSRKRAQVIDSDDEEDDTRNAGTSSSPAKRRKAIIQDSQQGQSMDDSDLDDLDSGDDDANGAEDDLQNEEVERGAVAFRPEYQRGDDGYVAGSVVRIKMTSFMTYDHVEFRPGPHLNMILGPNGTGKSSIAAAIAIGLGFAPKVMGRANDLKSYVKQGADQAMIEIELKGKLGKRNTIIWRKFNREDEKSEWKYNGSTCTRREILGYVEKFGIQANNLCSFLPQDKVAEFAKMAPEVVLIETMRAAGDPRLTGWHESLIEKGKNSKDIATVLEGHVHHRDRLQTQVNNLAPDVEHVQEREARETEAEILEHLVRLAQHKQLKAIANEAKNEKAKALKRINKLQDRRQPLKELKEHWDKKAQKAEVRQKTVETNYHNGMKEVRNKLINARNVGEKGSQVDEELSRLKLVFQRREDEKKTLTTKIQKCQDILDEPREEVDADVKSKSRKRADLQTAIRQKNHEIDEISDQYQDSGRMFTQLNHDLEELSRNQRALESIEIQKEKAARNFNPSIGWLLDWLEQNGHTLESQVHKPPMISASVPNKDYAWQVEQCTNTTARSTFICTSPADFDRLLEFSGKATYPPRQLENGRRIEGGTVRLTLALQEVTEAKVNPPRPCSLQQLQNMGMDGFAIDYVEAEPAVIAFLCSNSRLHATALTQKPSVQINGDALTAAGITKWATRDDQTSATQSSYGRRSFVQTTNLKRPAKAFNLAVDRDAVKQIVDEIARKKKIKFDREQPHSALKKKLDDTYAERTDMKNKVTEYDTEIKALMEKSKRWQTAATDMETHKVKLRKLEAQPSQEEARNKLKAEKLKFATARLRPLDSIITSSEGLFDQCTDLITASLTGLQTAVNQQAIASRMSDGSDLLAQAKDELEAAQMKADEASRRSVLKFEQLKSAIRDAPQNIKIAVTERGQDQSALPPLEDLEGQLGTLRAQLELAVNIPSNVVARYNDYKSKLEKAQDIVDGEEAELNGLKRDVKKTLDMFDPALETLVQAVSKKFSAAFARVKCTGEVRIRRVEGDFSAWGIEILVSYRDEDSLAILTGSHQSGGERSLATVTYLMSLSEMSRTPFSLVDEINQGMDQRAERAVHNQLVEVTCDANGGQYFLITPKLLTGLTYHPKMKVLIINNGTYLPDSRQSANRYGDLGSCLKKYQKKHSIAAR